MAESRDTIRKDLMRRWFAVAISVGFATTLVHMQWLNAGQLPNGDEWQQLARLTAALCAVVLSWEGYFISIETKPLTTTLRFVIDFVLVLLYMVLLYTSKIPTFWLYIHALSFLLYFWWDLLSINQYRGTYASAPIDGELSTSAIYVGGLLDRPGIYRGPIITLAWALFFACLAASQLLFGHRNSFLLAPFAIAGLLYYRSDKSHARSPSAHSMSWRVVRIIGMLIGVAIVSELLPDQTIASLLNCLRS